MYVLKKIFNLDFLSKHGTTCHTYIDGCQYFPGTKKTSCVLFYLRKSLRPNNLEFTDKITKVNVQYFDFFKFSHLEWIHWFLYLKCPLENENVRFMPGLFVIKHWNNVKATLRLKITSLSLVDSQDVKFPWNICSRYGMLTGGAHSSWSMVPPRWGPAYALCVILNPYIKLVMIFRIFHFEPQFVRSPFL